MAYSLLASLSLLVILCSSSCAHGAPPTLTLTVVNNCNFTVWPAIQPNGGLEVLARGGFTLHTLTHHSFPAPSSLWSGRIWFECAGAWGTLPTTLAQFNLHHGRNSNVSSYGVSLVDGFNVPMTVTPYDGLGTCPVVGCRENLLDTCPNRLQVTLHGPVVGCRSGCDALGTYELCCRKKFNTPVTCRSSNYSDFYKRTCPTTLTYAHDNAAFMYECASPQELKVIFCH